MLLTRVLYLKETDAKKLRDRRRRDERPHPAVALRRVSRRSIPCARRSDRPTVVDVVGPVCESGDFLAKDRELAASAPGELLAVLSAGAYGFVMASNYNTRPRAAEVLVDGSTYHVVRTRETLEDLVRGETIPESLR